MKFLILFCLLPFSVMAKSFMPTSFSANYEESFYSATTGKDKKSFGKIDYKFPGHIRLEITTPDQLLFVSNPRKSWYYTPPFVPGEQGQVTIQKSSKLPLTRLLDSIKNGVEDSKLFTFKYAGKELKLTFRPEQQKEMTLKEVTLMATKDAKAVEALNQFEKLILVYVDGRKVNLKFIDLKENVTFAADHFNFKVPEKTKVTNQ